MLRAAVETAAVASPASAGNFEQAEKVVEACVPADTSATWRNSFAEAVSMMLKKTRRTMQQGLSGLGESVATLVDGCSCDAPQAFAVFREQATRLRVLSTSRGGLAGLDSKVRYEPLQALKVGDIDVHSQLNALIVAWQLQKGPHEVGQALTRLLLLFANEPEEQQQVQPEAKDVVPEQPDRAAEFWATALKQAFVRLGDATADVSGCLTADAAATHSHRLTEAFNSMMLKTRRGMQEGLKHLAEDTGHFINTLGASCERLRYSDGARRLSSAAGRLAVLAKSRTLMKHSVHVEYEALKVLKIGGIDAHLELNRFIGAWINKKSAEELGEALADFFEDFKEIKEDDDNTALPKEVDPFFSFFRDAILAAQAGRNEPLDLPTTCFTPKATTPFGVELQAAVDEMLKKRKLTMQHGLRDLAQATDKLLAEQPVECVWSSGAKTIWLAAKKLRTLTRRTVVDYGTHIQYEAMKSLQVGNVLIHAELNSFLATWKLRSQQEAGTPFGELMLKLSALEVNDEL